MTRELSYFFRFSSLLIITVLVSFLGSTLLDPRPNKPRKGRTVSPGALFSAHVPFLNQSTWPIKDDMLLIITARTRGATS